MFIFFLVAGTTGEGVTMSVNERKQVLEAWIQASKGKDVHVIAHVGSEALSDVKELTLHAVASGAVAIAAMPTSFFKPNDIEAILRYFEIISNLAPKTPLYYYHLAIKTGVFIRCDKLLIRVAELQKEGKLLNFRGIKYSDADLHILSNCLALHNGMFDCLYGKDEQFLGAWAMGCKGAVGSTYNYMGRTYNRMIEAANKGDMVTALAEQRKAQLGVDLLYNSADYGHPAAHVGKAIMSLRLGGKYCGPPRAPMVAVTPAGMEKLKADLTKLGFFDW